MTWRLGIRWLAAVALVTGCSSNDEPDSAASSTTVATAPATDDLHIEMSPLLGRPAAVAVHDDVVWVADDGHDVVLRLDAGNGSELGPPIAVPPAPIALAIGDGGLWVAGATGSLARVDVVTAELGVVHELGGAPSDLLVVGGTVWVADIEASAVVPIEAASGTPGPPVPVPAGAVRLAASAERLWVTNLEDTVTSIRLDTHAVGEPLVVGLGPIGLTVANGIVWVANGDDGTVSRLDEESGEPVGDPVRVGSAPVAVAAVGDALWVIEQDGRSASRLDPRTGDVELRSGDLSTRPRGIASSAGALWVVGVDPSAAVLIPAGT